MRPRVRLAAARDGSRRAAGPSSSMSPSTATRRSPPARARARDRGVERLGARVVAVVDEDDASAAAAAPRSGAAPGVKAATAAAMAAGGMPRAWPTAAAARKFIMKWGPGRGSATSTSSLRRSRGRSACRRRAAPVLGRDLERAVAAEPEHGPGKASPMRRTRGSSPFSTARALRAQALQDLRLGLRDLVRGAEELEVGAAHVGDHGEVRLGDRRRARGARRRRTCPARARPRRCSGASRSRLRGRPYWLFRLPSVFSTGPARGQERGRQVLGRGLARGAGDGHDRRVRLRAAMARQVGEGAGGVGHAHERAAAAATASVHERARPRRARPPPPGSRGRRSAGPTMATKSSPGWSVRESMLTPGAARSRRRGARERAPGGGGHLGESRAQERHRSRAHRLVPLTSGGRARRAPPAGRRRARCARAAPGTSRGPCPRSRPRRRGPPSRGRARWRRAGPRSKCGRAFAALRECPAGSPRRMASGGSLRGLSEVTITRSERREATAPMSGRLVRSRSPPQPKTVMSAARPQLAQRLQEVLERVVGVGVVHHHREVLARLDALQPARHAGEGRDPAERVLGRDAQGQAGAEGGEDVLHVEATHERRPRRRAGPRGARPGSGCPAATARSSSARRSASRSMP